MKKLILTMVLMLFMALLNLKSQPNVKWEGEWKASKNYSFKIKDVTEKDFYYTFSCFNGTNFGEAEGKAEINGNTATSIPPDNQACKIKFILSDGFIEVIDVRDNDCYVDAGNGVSYGGKYKQKAVKSTKKKK